MDSACDRVALLGQIRSGPISGTGAAMALGNQLKAGSTQSHLILGRQDLADLKEGGSKLAERG